jgi:hypothetical protein
LEEPHVSSTQLPKDEDVRPTSIEEEEESPILKEDTNDPIETLDEIPQHGDIEGPLEVLTEKKVEPKEAQPSFDEVPRSLELPINHAINETQGDVGVHALQEGKHFSEVEEPQIPHKLEFQAKEALTLEKPYVPSIEQPQDQDVQPASIEEEEESPILKEDTNDPIEALDKLPQHGDIEQPFEVPIEKKLEPEEAQPSFDEVPRSLQLLINHAIEETQGDVGVEALQEGKHLSELEEPQIPHKFEAQGKESLTLQKPYIPSIQQPQDQDVKPTSIEDLEGTPIVKEDTNVPIQSSHEFPQDRDVEAPLEVATRKEVEPEEVQPTFEEVPKSLELPSSDRVEEFEGNVGVQSLQEGECVLEVEEPHIRYKFDVEENEAPTLE